jgi:phosphatidylethanolamine-binding protein (PEBP) family uncharacterized protein
MKYLLPAGVALGLVLAGIAPYAAEAPTGFIVTSSTFRDGGPMPVRTAYDKTPSFPNCVGENISPALSWTKPYPGVRSYTVTMVDLEDMANDIDLVAYGIAANVTSFAEGEFSHASEEFTGGKGSRGQTTWRGMCPPPGMSPHHYAFTVRRTDLDPKALPPGLTYAELDNAVKGHQRGIAVIVGTFVHR